MLRCSAPWARAFFFTEPARDSVRLRRRADSIHPFSRSVHSGRRSTNLFVLTLGYLWAVLLMDYGIHLEPDQRATGPYLRLEGTALQFRNAHAHFLFPVFGHQLVRYAHVGVLSARR